LGSSTSGAGKYHQVRNTELAPSFENFAVTGGGIIQKQLIITTTETETGYD